MDYYSKLLNPKGLSLQPNQKCMTHQQCLKTGRGSLNQQDVMDSVFIDINWRTPSWCLLTTGVETRIFGTRSVLSGKPFPLLPINSWQHREVTAVSQLLGSLNDISGLHFLKKRVRDFREYLENSNIFMEPKTTELKSKADIFFSGHSHVSRVQSLQNRTLTCYLVKYILCLYGRHR